LTNSLAVARPIALVTPVTSAIVPCSLPTSDPAPIDALI